jgi:hypothetical protein
VRTTVAVAILLGAVWWLGKAVGQHRRAQRQMGIPAPQNRPFPTRPGGLTWV